MGAGSDSSRGKIMKKGMYFMLVSVIFLLVFTTMVFIMNVSDSSETIQSKNYRVQLMNDFLSDFENDAPRAMYVASFRAFIALEEYVFTNGHYLNDTEKTFSEVFYNGTLDGVYQSIMNDSSISDYLIKVNSIANKLGLNIDFLLTNISLEQNNSWNVLVTISGVVNLTEANNLASWNYETFISSLVPIYDLRDPLYTIGTNGKLLSPIKKWNSSIEFVEDSTNSTVELQNFLNGTYYVESVDAPSFLMRFEGDNSASENGIASLVNLRILGDQGVNIETGKSVVDYVYFNANSTNNYCNISGMIFDPNWFIVDQANANLFEVDELSKLIC